MAKKTVEEGALVSAAKAIGKTSVAEVKEGWARKYELRPEDLGLLRYTYEELAGGTPEENARIVQAILSGREKGARLDMVAANAGAALYVAGKAPTVGIPKYTIPPVAVAPSPTRTARRRSRRRPRR